MLSPLSALTQPGPGDGGLRPRLAIVHGVAQAMGGEVRCEASPLGGARFCFSWPVYHQLPDFTSA